MICLLLHPDGTDEVVVLDDEYQCNRTLGTNSVTFVGAVDDLHVVALGVRYCDDLPLNRHCTDDRFFETPVRGPVLLVASDRDGGRMDVDVPRIRSVLKAPTAP